MKQLTIIGYLLMISVFLTGCSYIDGLLTPEEETIIPPLIQTNTGVIAEGRIVPLDSAYLIFNSTGRIAEILVEEGQLVVKGDTLAWLDNRPQLDMKVSEAELAVMIAQQSLDKLRDNNPLLASQLRVKLAETEKAYLDAQEAKEKLDTQETQDKIDDAWEEVLEKEDDLTEAQDEFERYKDLDADNSSRKNAETDLEEAQQAYDQALREYKRLGNNLEKVRSVLTQAEIYWTDLKDDYENRQNGPDPDELALAEAQLATAQAQLAAAKDMLSALELRAPFDGTIVEVYQAEGEVASPGQAVILLADFSQWFIETTDLTEIEVVKLVVDDRAVIIPDALKDVSLQAVIVSISQDYKERSGDVIYRVKLSLPELDQRLRWGMTVEIQFTEP